MRYTEFEEIFKECMKVDKAHGVQVDDYTGEEYHYDVDVKPCMVIRDFSIDVSDMQDSGVWDMDVVDKEFTDVKKAWDYFLEVYPYCRVMDNAGRIFFDYYSDKAENEGAEKDHVKAYGVD